jgi:hypothetical protein
MKTATTLGMAALLVTAGAAVADQPVVLTDTQLDRITAGQVVTEQFSLNFEEIRVVFEGEIKVTFAGGKLDGILIDLHPPGGSVEHALPGVGKR